MSQLQTTQEKKFPIKEFFNQPSIQKKFQELIGKNSAAFATSVLQIVNSNAMLRNADPGSVFNAACMAATLNLPLQNGLGFAYIVPYQNKREKKNRSAISTRLQRSNSISATFRTI
ncbi:phage recombinase [[Actinobacillus] rossii]|uniref:Phage recombinase n=1 Tax=[Actinobacillus] rossii TaxID=123820 RepID=A0A376BDU8_9PAST|nr:phage recombinase [[Actinobacillus] rossii]